MDFHQWKPSTEPPLSIKGLPFTQHSVPRNRQAPRSYPRPFSLALLLSQSTDFLPYSIMRVSLLFVVSAIGAVAATPVPVSIPS